VRKLIPIFLNRTLKEWDAYLSARPAEEKATARGKIVAQTCTQTGTFLAPFYKLLRKDQVAYDVLLRYVIISNVSIYRVTEICEFTQQREYQKANDAYIKMSIGNAAWPIGVTAVGIHERAGNDKRSGGSTAGHVLNDEVTRRWIQSIKRLVTFCQVVRPPSDGSKSMG
jgi:pre-mRNA-splicing factor 18